MPSASLIYLIMGAESDSRKYYSQLAWVHRILAQIPIKLVLMISLE